MYDILYGIAQNPDTKDYVMVLKNQYCKGCGEKYTAIRKKWCKPCHIKNANAISSSKNEKIDDLVQEMQLKINCDTDKIFEWIPYDQFNNIKEISKDDFSILYSTTWKNRPLEYYNNKWMRSDENVTLKCLLDSSSTINKLLNEV
jgi:hypothetical protein